MPSDTLTRAVQPADPGQAVDQAPRLPAPIAALNSPAMLEQITESLPRGMDPAAFKRHAITLVKQTPKLLECEAASVAQGIVRGAALGLDPDPALGQMWLVPRNTKVSVGGRDQWISVATFQVGYRGLYELAMRTGQLAKVEVKAVHENDHFEARLGSQGGLDHRPDWFGDRGPVVGWYAYALRKDGAETFEVLSVADAERHRDRFGPKGRGDKVYGPWVDHFEAMAMKTVFIKLAKWLPKQVEVARALEADGQAVLTPVGGEVRPQDVIEASHTPDAEPERPAIAPAADLPGEVLPPAATETSGDDGSSSGNLPLADENGEPIETGGGEAPAEPAAPPTDVPAPADTEAARAHQRKLFATVKDLWKDLDDGDRETRRHALVGIVTDRRSESTNDLTDAEWRDLWDLVDLLKDGGDELHLKASGEWIVRHVPRTRKAPTVPASRS